VGGVEDHGLPCSGCRRNVKLSEIQRHKVISY
jgi:hypothetical protein